MSLFDGILDQYDPPAPPVAERGYVVTITRASGGQRIMICSADPAPRAAIDEARRAGCPLFTIAEIPLMKQAVAADQLFLDHIISAKCTFPGAHISQFISEGA